MEPVYRDDISLDLDLVDRTVRGHHLVFLMELENGECRWILGQGSKSRSDLNFGYTNTNASVH